jgi:hypothetical protein
LQGGTFPGAAPGFGGGGGMPFGAGAVPMMGGAGFGGGMAPPFGQAQGGFPTQQGGGGFGY